MDALIVRWLCWRFLPFPGPGCGGEKPETATGLCSETGFAMWQCWCTLPYHSALQACSCKYLRIYETSQPVFSETTKPKWVRKVFQNLGVSLRPCYWQIWDLQKKPGVIWCCFRPVVGLNPAALQPPTAPLGTGRFTARPSWRRCLRTDSPTPSAPACGSLMRCQLVEVEVVDMVGGWCLVVGV